MKKLTYERINLEYKKYNKVQECIIVKLLIENIILNTLPQSELIFVDEKINLTLAVRKY